MNTGSSCQPHDLDGVIFTGGEDIAPTLLATLQDWHHIEAEIDYNAARDVSDFLTMTYCLDHDIPLIGFCRGAQMLGVVSGATIIQDIPTWFAQQGLSYHYEHRREKSETIKKPRLAIRRSRGFLASLLSFSMVADLLLSCTKWKSQFLENSSPCSCILILLPHLFV